MANVCIIPARGGSKRIKNKNIRCFAGRPIIEWSIEAASQSGIFESVIVSTDSEKVAQVAKAAGAEVPFVRPSELSGDFVGTIPVIKHAIIELESAGMPVANACCVYATAPFVTPGRIKEAYEKVNAEPMTQFVFPVTSFPFPIFRGVELGKDDSVSMIWPDKEQVRSQDLPQAYHDAGQFYWGKRDAFVKELSVFSPHSKGLVVPRREVQDIDTEEDWETAELLFKALERSPSE